MKLSYWSLLVPAVLMGCQAKDNTVPTADTVQITEGLSIVTSNCGSCHNVGTAGDSPRVDAPPLRTVLANYNVESLADDFREHIHVGHPDMPDFDFGPKGTDAVIVYLKSIQEKP
ncbi:MAG: cytochrome c [Hellea sp.]